MNENNNSSEYKVFATVDGEMVPVTVGAPIDGVQFTSFVSILSGIPHEITLTMSQVSATRTRFNSYFSRVFENMLIALACELRPKWVHYYRHGRSGMTRRKYRKMLFRLGRGVLGHAYQ